LLPIVALAAVVSIPRDVATLTSLGRRRTVLWAFVFVLFWSAVVGGEVAALNTLRRGEPSEAAGSALARPLPPLLERFGHVVRAATGFVG
jgi:hypothetical protein